MGASEDALDARDAMDGLFHGWARRTFSWAVAYTVLSVPVSVLLLAAFIGETAPAWLLLALASGPAALVYAASTRRIRRRRALLAQPFPKVWELVLERDVVFYRVLEPAEKLRFRRLVQVFIGEKPRAIPGSGTPRKRPDSARLSSPRPANRFGLLVLGPSRFKSGSAHCAAYQLRRLPPQV